MGGSLNTLPFDVVLRIFHFLSAHDVVRTCQTCRWLGATLGERCVWLGLAEKCCSKNASLARHVPPLAALSTGELQAFVVGQARLDQYWITETTFTNPRPRFRLQAPNASLFCELLPGGEYLILVRRDGNISLLSLVDLGDIHMVSEFSIGLHSGHPHDVSLTTDNTGRLLLILCMYGPLRRRLLKTFEIGIRSINLVKSFGIEMPVSTIAAQHETIACLCQDTEQAAFSFVITTVNDKVNRTLHVSPIPADPATIYLCDICLPTPTTLLLFEASNIRCYHLPDVSGLSPGDHHLPGLSPIWSWENRALPTGRLTATSVRWEPSCTTPVVVTFLCDFLSHVVTLRPPEKSSGSSHLDVIEHTYANFRPVSIPCQGTMLLKSEKGMWYRPWSSSKRPNDFVTFSTNDVQRTGLVRVGALEVDMQDYLVPAVNFDEVSGRIVVLVRARGGNSHVDHGFVVDMP